MILPTISFPQQRNRKLLRYFIWMLPALLGLSVSAQTLRAYQSKTFSPNNRPVQGAQIENLNKVLKTTSAKDGSFSIQAATGDSLRVAAAGFRTIFHVVPEVAVPKLMLLSNDTTVVESVLPVQRIYTSVPATLNTASNDVVYSKDITKSPTASYRNAITGRLAGLYTTQASGFPGNDAPTFTLRGQTPIVIIDGVVANLT